jgi:hypothetical protein
MNIDYLYEAFIASCNAKMATEEFYLCLQDYSKCVKIKANQNVFDYEDAISNSFESFDRAFKSAKINLKTKNPCGVASYVTKVIENEYHKLYRKNKEHHKILELEELYWRQCDHNHVNTRLEQGIDIDLYKRNLLDSCIKDAMPKLPSKLRRKAKYYLAYLVKNDGKPLMMRKRNEDPTTLGIMLKRIYKKQKRLLEQQMRIQE